jgi:hypothetical protein
LSTALVSTPERRPAARRVTVVDAEFTTDRDGVDEWANRISSRWRQSVEGILDVGQLLLTAKSNLAHGEFGAMIQERLPFGPRTAQLLMAIARSPLLRDPKSISLLPPNWGTLAALARLDAATLQAAFDKKLIRADLKPSDVQPIALEARGLKRPPRKERLRRERLRNRFISHFADLLGKDLRHRLACLSAADREKLSKLLVSEVQSHLVRIARCGAGDHD